MPKQVEKRLQRYLWKNEEAYYHTHIRPTPFYSF